MRQFFAIVIGAASLVAAGGGESAPTAVEVRVCVQRSSFFNVQILGDRDATAWGPVGRTVGVPDRRTVVAVWSNGGPAATSGFAVYGWITEGRSRLASYCSRTQTGRRESTRGNLRPRVHFKDGWGAGPRFACLQRGRFVVEVRDLSNGKRMTVRMERTGELIAVAEVRRGGGWLRGSTRCEQRS